MAMNDIKITIIDRNGETHTIDAPTDMGMNLMELIRAYELAEEGTLGICGGMAMCASCQCYVLNENEVAELPEKNPDEEAMLWEAYQEKDNSRLSCKITNIHKIDGLKIQIAP